MGNSRGVLAVCEDDADRKNLIRHLENLSGEVHVTADPSEGERLFLEYSPPVLLLCLQNVERAKNYYLRLLRSVATAAPAAHQAVLLCSTSEMTAACAIASEGLVDDYLVYKPLLHPSALVFCVAQARKRHELQQSVAALRARLAEGGEAARGLDQFIQARVSQTEELRKEMSFSEQELFRSVKKRVEAFEERLADSESRDVLVILDRAAFAQRFDALAEDELGEAFEQFESAVSASIERWFTELRGSYDRCAEPIRDMGTIASHSGMSILVVEDDPDVRALMRRILEMEQYPVRELRDGSHLLEQALKHRPSLVLLDIELPGTDGLELLKRLQAQPELKDIPVMMVTSSGSKEVVKESVAGGAADFLAKPVTVGMLLDRVGKVLGEGEGEPPTDGDGGGDIRH